MLWFDLQEAFILFDLIGSTNPHPTFYDMYRNTSPLFQRFVKIGEGCVVCEGYMGEGCVVCEGYMGEGCVCMCDSLVPRPSIRLTSLSRAFIVWRVWERD